MSSIPPEQMAIMEERHQKYLEQRARQPLRIGLTIYNEPIGIIHEAKVRVRTEFNGEQSYGIDGALFYYFQARYDSEHRHVVYVLVFDADGLAEAPTEAVGGYESHSRRIHKSYTCSDLDSTKIWIAVRNETVGRVESLSKTRSAHANPFDDDAEIRLHCILNIRKRLRGVIVMRHPR